MKEDLEFKQHLQDFYGETGSKLRKPRDRSRARSPLDKIQKDETNMLEQDKTRFDRGATPGRAIISNLKPAPPRNTDVFELNSEPKCDLKQHFKEFMSTTNKKDSSVARARLVYFANDKTISIRSGIQTNFLLAYAHNGKAGKAAALPKFSDALTLSQSGGADYV